MTLYNPPHFRGDDPETLLAFIEENAFGTLATSGEGGLQVSHLPFLAEREEGRVRLLGHVARNNPHATALEAARDQLVIIHGPHAYVSPSWYANHPSVPTWNYAVVHAHGRARLMDEPALHDLLMRLSARYEAGRPNAWRMSGLPPAYVEGMLAAIVGFEVVVERLEGKFKLSQNRPDEIPRVIAALEAAGERPLADLMRAHPPKARV